MKVQMGIFMIKALNKKLRVKNLKKISIQKRIQEKTTKRK